MHKAGIPLQLYNGIIPQLSPQSVLHSCQDKVWCLVLPDRVLRVVNCSPGWSSLAKSMRGEGPLSSGMACRRGSSLGAAMLLLEETMPGTILPPTTRGIRFRPDGKCSEKLGEGLRASEPTTSAPRGVPTIKYQALLWGHAQSRLGWPWLPNLRNTSRFTRSSTLVGVALFEVPGDLADHAV